MKIQLVVDDVVRFEKTADLTPRQIDRLIARVTQTSQTTAELIANGQAAAIEMEAKLTASQKAERALMNALSPQERTLQMILSQQQSLDVQLANLTIS